MKDATVVVRRRARQARLREERSFHIWAATATADLVQKPVRPLTDAAYDRMLEEWDVFARESIDNVSPLDVATLKRFLKWYCDGRKGRLPATPSDGGMDQRITQNSAYTCWKSFMSAWHRRTGDTFSRSIQHTIETLIYGGDDNWLNLRTARRPTRNFTLTDFQACVRQLWQNDWYDFRCESYRIGLHLMMLMHIGTSARSAEYVINLRYRDTMLYQIWFEDRSQPQLVIDLCRNHTKGLANLPRQQPEHLLYELVDLPFYYNTVAFFVAGLLAVKGLRDFESWSDICAATKPRDRNFLCLEYADDVGDRHVYARYTAMSEHETRPATSLVNALGLLGQRTGFRERPTPGAIRREALLQVDRHGYSINERMRHADHRNANTYGGYYQNAISTVDGQATYFGLEQQMPVLHELFRGFSIRRDYQFRPEVPLRLQSQMSEAQPVNVTENENDIVGQQKRQAMYSVRRRLRNKLLRTDRQSTAREATTSADCAYESDFQPARRLMPERNRLAESLFQTGSLRDAQGTEVMHDLVTLYSARNSETYCLELNSSRSRCDTCGVTCSDITGQEWWRHVYHCRRARSEFVGGFTDFCFLCFMWIDDVDAWSMHVQQHCQNLPLKCSLAMFRGTVLRPAWCPDCIGNAETSGTDGKRWTQFLNVTAWKAHMDQHVQEWRPGKYKCPHPRCARVSGFWFLTEYIAHRFDIHLIPPPDAARTDATKWMKRGNTDTAANEASCVAARSQLSGGRSSSRGSAIEAFEEPSTHAIAYSSPEASSPSSGPGGCVLTEEDNGGGGHEKVGVAPPASATNLDTDQDQTYQHWSPLSPASTSGISSSSSSSSLSGSRDTSCASVGFRPVTIDVVIPASPPGWENVPFIGCTDCPDETARRHTACEEDAPNNTPDEPGKGQVAHVSRPAFHFSALSRQSKRPKKIRVDKAGSTSKGIVCKAEKSAAVIRRRNAIAEMHARIQERCKSRLKTACA